MNDELLEQYKAMAKQGTMEERIDAHLKANCEKYDPKKLKDCVKHLVDVAREILDGKNGEVPDEVCFKICRDYFNDEMWTEKPQGKKAKKKKTVAEKAREKLATNDTKKPVFESTPTPPNPIIKAVEEAKPCTKEQRVQHCEGQLDMFGMLFEGATA